MLSICTQILPGSSDHSFYSLPPSPIPFQKIYKQSYTHIISSRYLDPCECDWCFPATQFGFPASAFRCQQKHDTLLTAVCVLDTFLQNTTVQKGARAPLRIERKVASPWFPPNHIPAPPACSKSPLLPPGQKKEKPQKLIKTKNKPFRSHSFEHILVFLSKTHHSTINHKSP